MTVLILRIVGIDEPFLQLSIATDLHGWQLFKGLSQGGIRRQSEDCSGFQGAGQHVEHNLVVHRRASGDVGLLPQWAVLR